jgi:hypothetical protein
LLDGCRHGGVRRFACRERDEALDVLGAEQTRQKRHQLERFGKLVVLPGGALIGQGAEILQSLARQIDDPCGGPLVLRPSLGTRVSSGVELQVPRVAVEARLPALKQVVQAFFR